MTKILTELINTADMTEAEVIDHGIAVWCWNEHIT